MTTTSATATAPTMTMPVDGGAKVSAGEMELTPIAMAEKEPLNPGEDLETLIHGLSRSQR